MAKFLSVKKEVSAVALTPIVAGPGLKKALKEKLAFVAEEHGGVAQYLNARFTTAEHREILRNKLIALTPRRSDKKYLELTGNPPDGSAGCVHIAELGFFSKCSVRPWPQFNVCSDIFDDILAKKFPEPYESAGGDTMSTRCG